MSEKLHYKLSPSGSACWTRCTAAPGYVASLNLPTDPGSIYAEQGTLAHHYAEKILRHLLLGGPAFTLADIPDDAWPPHLQDEYLRAVGGVRPSLCRGGTGAGEGVRGGVRAVVLRTK